MNNFDKTLNNLTEDFLCEMASFSPKQHGFGVDIKINIMQPADKYLPHGPRVKCYKSGINGDFSISLNIDPDKIKVMEGDYTKFLSTKEVNLLIKKIIKYRIVLLNLWLNPRMTGTDAEDEFRQVDSGFEVELIKANSWDKY
jgi:hypothetical protein